MSAVNEGSTIGVLHGRKSATREDAREQLASKACAMPERVASTPGFLLESLSSSFISCWTDTTAEEC